MNNTKIHSLTHSTKSPEGSSTIDTIVCFSASIYKLEDIIKNFSQYREDSRNKVLQLLSKYKENFIEDFNLEHPENYLQFINQLEDKKLLNIFKEGEVLLHKDIQKRNNIIYPDCYKSEEFTIQEISLI